MPTAAGGWPPVPGWTPRLAETVALAADDVLLDDLLARLAQVPGAAASLLGDLGVPGAGRPQRGAVPGRAAGPGRRGHPRPAAAFRQITSILAAAGITVDESFDLASVPAHVAAQLAPHIAELNRRPVPPFRPSDGLSDQIAACQAASLLTVSDEGQEPWFFVHRWTATELAERAADRPPGQGRTGRPPPTGCGGSGYGRKMQTADVHDLLEARHHLLQAGDTEAASQVTERVCRRAAHLGCVGSGSLADP